MSKPSFLSGALGSFAPNIAINPYVPKGKVFIVDPSIMNPSGPLKHVGDVFDFKFEYDLPDVFDALGAIKAVESLYEPNPPIYEAVARDLGFEPLRRTWKPRTATWDIYTPDPMNLFKVISGF